MDQTTDPRALEIRDASCDALLADLRKDPPEGTDMAEVETFVRDLFASMFAASQQKNEAPETAAPKIARIIAKRARQMFPAPAATAAAEPETPRPSGTVTGKTTGIDRKILAILNEVSAFYETPIAILSGQRSKRVQAMSLYTNWQSHLRRGKDNAWLAKNDKLRTQLDELKQERDRDGFLDLLDSKADWPALSRHITGEEVDLAANTDPNIVAALATCLNHSQGRNSEGARCHHFDSTKSVWPILESTRARWKR